MVWNRHVLSGTEDPLAIPRWDSLITIAEAFHTFAVFGSIPGRIWGRIGFTIGTPIFPCPFHRWHYLNLLSFLELLVSLSCIGGVANVNGGTFLQGQRSSLLSEIFFQCPPEPRGRRLRSGGKNTVCVWYSAQHSSHALHRLRHYSRQCFRQIYCYFEFIRSRRQPPWQKIQYLLQQVSWNTFFSGRIRRNIFLN